MRETMELAGQRITITHNEDGNDVVTFSAKGNGRVCGSCTLCCKLLPVPGAPLHKRAGVRCQHQRAKGCGIYPDRPFACASFACRWLADADTAGMPRPDRCHYVTDMVNDYVEAVPDDGGARTRVGVVQVWLDPGWPDAHRDPQLRAYMLRMAARDGLATIVRLNSREAFTVFPPPLSEDGQWHEVTGQLVSRTVQDAQVFADLQRGAG